MDKPPQLRRRLQGHRTAVTDIAFSPINATFAFSSKMRKNQQLLASSSLEGILTLWSFPWDKKTNENSRTKRSEEVRTYRYVFCGLFG